MDTQAAREILEKKIANGKASAVALFQRMEDEAPRDSVAKGRALRFDTRAAALGSPELVVNYQDTPTIIHRHALGQFAQRASIPSQYLRELAEGTPWQRQLAATTLNEHYHQGAPDDRYLVREVKGQVRGFLSDKYRRLDSRPLMAAFIEETQKIGAVPIDGIASDTRVSMRALLPTVYEPVTGEVIAFGVEWGNSDFGAALHSVRAFILRLICLNGATMANDLAQVHLGRGISDDVELSARTYALDTRTSISALRDVVGNVLAPKRVEQLCAGIRTAHENQVDWKSVKASLATKLLKGEMQKAQDAFEGPDVVNLPAGNSMWRVSNAISWLAGSTEDADRKLELNRIAGQVLDGKKEVAIAA